MRRHGQARAAIVVATCLLIAGCGSREQASSSGAANGLAAGGSPQSGEVAATAAVPNACTFFQRSELESAVGWELREGEPRDASAGSSCSFESPPAMYTKRKFPNPALQGSVGFSSLTVTTYPSRPDSFAQGKTLPGAEAVASLGDDAYFNGANLLQVRVGGRGFSVRIYTDAVSPADAEKVRAVMLALGKAGASRL